MSSFGNFWHSNGNFPKGQELIAPSTSNTSHEMTLFIFFTLSLSTLLRICTHHDIWYLIIEFRIFSISSYIDNNWIDLWIFKFDISQFTLISSLIHLCRKKWWVISDKYLMFTNFCQILKYRYFAKWSIHRAKLEHCLHLSQII